MQRIKPDVSSNKIRWETIFMIEISKDFLNRMQKPNNEENTDKLDGIQIKLFFFFKRHH